MSETDATKRELLRAADNAAYDRMVAETGNPDELLRYEYWENCDAIRANGEDWRLDPAQRESNLEE